MLEPPYYFRKLSSNAPLKKKKKEWAGLYFFIAVCALHFAAFITFSTTLKKVEPVKKRIAVQTVQLASKEPASSLMQKSPAILPKENLIATASTAIEPPQKVVSAPVEKQSKPSQWKKLLSQLSNHHYHKNLYPLKSCLLKKKNW